MRVVGLISGTSFDGIDVAAVELTRTSDVIEIEILGDAVLPYEPELRREIATVLPPARTTAEAVARLDTALGQAFAAAAVFGVEELCGGAADLVASHGQTIYHWHAGGRTLGSLQLGEPAWIAERAGLPVVSGFRTRDIAAGGQGAPLVSMIDSLMLAGLAEPAIALNIGGIANITVVRPGESPLAYDTGPGNALIDAAVTHLSGGAIDHDTGGAWAQSGNVNRALLEVLLDEPFLRQPPPKSTGKELYNLDYLLRAVRTIGDLESADIVATATELTIRTVATACRAHNPDVVMVSGGGLYNSLLMDRLTEELGPARVRSIDLLGIPAKAKEAVAFAVLGFLTVSGLPGTIESCTGARRATILGSITPGASALRVPPAAADPPRRLVVRR